MSASMRVIGLFIWVSLLSRRRAKIGTHPIVAYYWEKGAQRFLSKQDAAFALGAPLLPPKDVRHMQVSGGQVPLMAKLCVG